MIWVLRQKPTPVLGYKSVSIVFVTGTTNDSGAVFLEVLEDELQGDLELLIALGSGILLAWVSLNHIPMSTCLF